MVQTIELARGGGGSIKVGTTGTIGSLMTKEMESMNSTPSTSNNPRSEPPTTPVSVFCGGHPPKLQLRTDASSEASSSNSSVHRSVETAEKTTRNTKKPAAHSHRKTDPSIPMLESNGEARENKKTGKKPNKKDSCSPSSSRSYIVEVVDVKCGGNSEKSWSSPITNRLRKLGFSKLSNTL